MQCRKFVLGETHFVVTLAPWPIIPPCTMIFISEAMCIIGREREKKIATRYVDDLYFAMNRQVLHFVSRTWHGNVRDMFI